MRYFFNLLAPFWVLVLASCVAADIPSAAPPLYQPVTVLTPGQEGVRCFVQAGAQSFSLRAPATINVHRSTAPLDISCFKGEHMRAQQQVRPRHMPGEQDSGESCVTCLYPPTVTVVLGLNPRSLDVRFREIK